MDFDAYVSMDQELTMCGVLCIEEMCGVVGSGSCVEEGQGNGGGGGEDEAESEPVPSFSVNESIYVGSQYHRKRPSEHC
jgi:hypothetical protein